MIVLVEVLSIVFFGLISPSPFGLLMAVVVSIGALSLLIQRLPIRKMSTLFYLVPISALFLIICLNGDMSIIQAVGIILVSLSIFLVALFDQKTTVTSQGNKE